MPAPIPDTFPVRLDADDLAAALDHLRGAAAPAWQERLDTAAERLPLARPRIDRRDGALLLDSPASSHTYRLWLLAGDVPTVVPADDHRKVCLARANQRPCWHAAAAKLILRMWRACQPCWRCYICRTGPMIITKTYGGEDCAECLVCGYTRMAYLQDLPAWRPGRGPIAALRAA